MKQSIKQWLRRAGIAAVSAEHQGVRYIDRVPRTALESVIFRLFPDLIGLVFIQVGANDGQRVDPIHHFVKRHQWSGVLVEPVPELFRALTKTYSCNSRLQLVQAAVDLQSGQRPIFHLRTDLSRPLPDWAWGLATFDLNQLRGTIRQLGLTDEAITSTEVATITWSALWERVPSKRCDVLVVDTEGYDVTLLRGAELATRRPRVVHFEHALISLTDRLSFYQELMSAGYEIATDGPDTTAWLHE